MFVQGVLSVLSVPPGAHFEFCRFRCPTLNTFYTMCYNSLLMNNTFVSRLLCHHENIKKRATPHRQNRQNLQPPTPGKPPINLMTPTTTASKATLRPEYPDETTARDGGWHCITPWFYRGLEDDIIDAIHDTLDGTAPGAAQVRFCLVGDKHRVAFARLATELVGLPSGPDQAAPTAVAILMDQAA